MRQKPVVAIAHPTLQRYRARFYSELRARLHDAGVDLRLLHSSPPSDARDDLLAVPWSTHIPRRDIRVGGHTLQWQPYLSALRDVDLVVVEQASRLLLNYVLLAWQPAGGPRVAFWGHGRNSQRDHSHLGEAVKRRYSRAAHWWFAYTQWSADIVSELGYPRDRITVVNNATDSRELARQVAAVDGAGVRAAVQDLGLEGSCVGLFLGALHPIKRLDFLIEACQHVRRLVPSFELVLAGAGPEAPAVRAAARAHPWIAYAGRRDGEELAPLLRMAKVLLVPYGVGLVIVDGFASGLPLVTSASAPRPPEMAYLEHGRNGLLIEDRGDPLKYAEAVAGLLRDETRRRALVDGARASAGRYDAEGMAERFCEGLLAALKTKEARQ